MKKEENGGKWNVIRLSPSELEPNSVKMGYGNTAKSLIITLHMAVFSTAFVTKLSAQYPVILQTLTSYMYTHTQMHHMVLIKSSKMTKSD